MKYITQRPDVRDTYDRFPGLLKYDKSTRVKICGHTIPPVLYSYDVVVCVMVGDYDRKFIKDVVDLANVRKDRSNQVIVLSTINKPAEFNLPKNIHWQTFRSMYAVYTKNSQWRDQERPPIEKHFISLNHRAMWYRQELLYYFYKHNILDKSYFSYHFVSRFMNAGRPNNDSFQNNYTGNRELFDEEDTIIGADRYTDVNKDSIFNLLPYRNFQEPYVDNYSKFETIQDFYNRSAVVVDSETFSDSFLDYNAGITEKTLKPLIFGNPFLLYAGRGTLQLLQEMGFETYSSIIDESYDDIENPQKRFEFILEETLRLSKMDLKEMALMIKSIEKQAEHNQNHILVTLVKQLEEDGEILENLIRSLV
ncbi:hypothetical protein UFOVP112_90 [uncultured Caudovirales phage]|uniref:Uncharacterized protein n=1 Tax=uncultured Caudovirales phage TaxID=2100421 RepID=A0A6J5L755_9CAUD|nr:hypothetical protein UFOVP112_90 [uncultured Caudovirales phage]